MPTNKLALQEEFARRLTDFMVKQRLNQSELARRATSFMPKGEEVSRDRVSNYVNANQLPGPKITEALARALHVSPEELLPAQHIIRSARRNEATFSLTGTADGQARIVLNQEVPFDVALKITELLKGITHGPDDPRDGRPFPSHPPDTSEVDRTRPTKANIVHPVRSRKVR
jgi:transcriptional regulator with XRE-family HTH domain